jgi:extradiol dioxygenase family protein
MHPFHLALPASDLEKAREFYGSILGQQEKRSAPNWVDFDFFGHQLSIHLVRGKIEKVESTMIDGDTVPARHFGMVLDRDSWNNLREKLKGQRFIIGPKLRFPDSEGEQWTMFIVDPFGNYLEFKYFTDTSRGAWY